MTQFYRSTALTMLELQSYRPGLFPVDLTKSHFSIFISIVLPCRQINPKIPETKILGGLNSLSVSNAFNYKQQPQQVKTYSRDMELSHYSLLIPQYTWSLWLCHKNNCNWNPQPSLLHQKQFGLKQNDRNQREWTNK